MLTVGHWIEGWSQWSRPVQFFGATTKAMKHHVMGCLEDQSPNTIL